MGIVNHTSDNAKIIPLCIDGMTDAGLSLIITWIANDKLPTTCLYKEELFDALLRRINHGYVDNRLLFELVIGTNYVAIEDMFLAVCAVVSRRISEMNADEMRRFFSVASDLTPDEDDKLTGEMTWALEWVGQVEDDGGDADGGPDALYDADHESDGSDGETYLKRRDAIMFPDPEDSEVEEQGEPEEIEEQE
ncbi:hypothetical protein OQA88_8371 [Cercophora sp. LCS_1]